MSIKPLPAGVLQFRAHQSHAGISQRVVACSDCNTTAALQEHLPDNRCYMTDNNILQILHKAFIATAKTRAVC